MVFLRDEDHEGGVKVGGKWGTRNDVQAKGVEGLKDRGGIKGDDPIGVGDAVRTRGGVAEGGEDGAEVLDGEVLDKLKEMVREGLIEEGVKVGMGEVGRGELGRPVGDHGLGGSRVGDGEGKVVYKDVGDGRGAETGRPKLDPFHEFESSMNMQLIN